MEKLLKMTVIGLSLVIFITGCGDSEFNDSGETNIFSLSSEIEPQNANGSLMGLWESDEFTNLDFTQQVRWQVKENKMVFAKKCTLPSGVSFYAQISVALDTEDLQAMSQLSPYAVPVEDGLIIKITLMPGNRACRIAVDPANIQADSIVASGDSEFDMTSNDFGSGQLDLFYQTENRAGVLVKIRN